MAYSAAVRKSKSDLGVAARRHGSNSPEATQARLHHVALMAAEDLAGARATHGEFTPEDIDLICAALTGKGE